VLSKVNSKKLLTSPYGVDIRRQRQPLAREKNCLSQTKTRREESFEPEMGVVGSGRTHRDSKRGLGDRAAGQGGKTYLRRGERRRKAAICPDWAWGKPETVTLRACKGQISSKTPHLGQYIKGRAQGPKGEIDRNKTERGGKADCPPAMKSPGATLSREGLNF